MSEDSPFSPDRFEYERKHIYYLPQPVFGKLETGKPIYLVGTRGTGKTTLLHALNWKERLENKSLERALSEDVFKKQYVGIYLRMPHFEVESFDKWLSDEEDDVRGSIFGFYLDLIWTGLAAEALSELLSMNKEFEAPPSEEHKLIETIFNQYPEIVQLTSVETPCTLRQFARAINLVRGRIQKLAKLRVNTKELYDKYPLGQVGDFGRSVSNLLAVFCNKFSTRPDPHWHFKICIDEAECLSAFQQRVFNTAVRLSTGVAVYVISYVSKVEDITTTLLPRMTLQRADRELIILDDMSDREFEKLAEGVATTRIHHITGDYSTGFNTRQLLGSLKLNAILKEILDTSESLRAKELLEKATELMEAPFYRGMEWEGGSECQPAISTVKVPPIYEAYIVDRLKIKLPSPDEERWKKRSQESREIRKRMVAAYLCICRELKTEVRYAFAEMVFQMSDRCIRDFLAQMHHIYIEAGNKLTQFLNSTNVPIRKQDIALKRASCEKRDSLPHSGVTAPIEVGRVVDGLARITAIIQSQGPRNKPLLSSERGRFVIDTRSHGASQYSSELDFLKEANEAGFLRIINSESRRWTLQVHSSLAAAYGFSYRGAYYSCSLPLSDINELSQSEDKEDFDKIVEKIGKRLSGESSESPQLPLFEDKKI
jgi:energy-coupling factor transporter ATP-binding protein EcfA2